MIFDINTTRDISKLSQIVSITYNNFEISLVVFTPNITTNHAITYTNRKLTERLEIQNFPSKHFRIFYGMSTQKLREEKISYHRTAM